MYKKENYRGKYDIINDIIKVATTPAKKTHIVYQCNLNFTVLKRYLEMMISQNLLTPIKIKGKTLYQATELGNSLHQQLEQIVF